MELIFRTMYPKSLCTLRLCMLASSPTLLLRKPTLSHLKENKGPESWQGWGWNFGPAEQVAFDALQCTVSTVPYSTTIIYDAVLVTPSPHFNIIPSSQVALKTGSNNCLCHAFCKISHCKEHSEFLFFCLS